MLTLVVPVFNKARYLHRCLEALLGQQCRDFELLLIDDGSTDGSGAICDDYAARYPELVRVIHKPNGGLSSARNTGIDAARGEFISFPDPDDWVEPDYTAAFLALQREYEADLVCTGFWVDRGDRHSPGYADGPTVVLTGADGCRSLLLPPRIGGFSWNKLYRLDLIRDNNLHFRSDVGAAEDLDFAYRYLCLCRRVCFCPGRRTCHYDQHPDSVTNAGFTRRNLEDFRTYEAIAAHCAAALPDLADAAREEMCVQAVNHLWSLLESGRPDPQSKRILLGQIRKNLLIHLRLGYYGLPRKLQALTAALSPRLFAVLKGWARKRS